MTVPAPRREDWPETASDTTPDPAGPGPDAIIGIPAAARFLGYDKPDSFRRARTRHPVPGESKLPDGRPWWTPQTLRNWQGSRKIAGGRELG